MVFHSRIMLLALLASLLNLTFGATPWSLPGVTTLEPTAAAPDNSSITFDLDRAGTPTGFFLSWNAASTPTNAWIKSSDPLLRFRFATYNAINNFTLEIVEVDIISATATSTTSPSLTVTNATIIFTPSNDPCSTNSTGTLCTYSNKALVTTTESFAPAPLEIFYFLSKSDDQSEPACYQSWLIYLENPSVATLGHITLGHGSKEPKWETICESTWSCGSSDPFLNTWSSCNSANFQILKSYPGTGTPDALSNFDLTITHQFPLMMATSIRGSSTTDYQLTDPLEAPGLEVKLSYAPTVWKNGSTISALEYGGVDQTGNCQTGCEFGYNAYAYPSVVSLEII